MSTQYTYTQGQLKAKHGRTKHVVAFVAAPTAVFTVALAIWTNLKQQCVPMAPWECVAVGSTQLAFSDVALLATFLSAGLAAIVEVAAD
jgi:hypothetical protein